MFWEQWSRLDFTRVHWEAVAASLPDTFVLIIIITLDSLMCVATAAMLSLVFSKRECCFQCVSVWLTLLRMTLVLFLFLFFFFFSRDNFSRYLRTSTREMNVRINMVHELCVK